MTFTLNFLISILRASEKAIQALFDMEYAANAGIVKRPAKITIHVIHNLRKREQNKTKFTYAKRS